MSRHEGSSRPAGQPVDSSSLAGYRAAESRGLLLQSGNRMDPSLHVQPSAPGWRKQAAAAALLLGLVFFAYIPAMQADFIWDDNLLLTDYYLMQAKDGLQRFWFKLEAPDYYPLTWTTLWIEWRLWGRDATGYHVANVAMHALGALLLWRVLRRLRMPGAYLAAAVFAVHPVTMASVGWISERKNVLSILFYLLTILWFLRSQESRRPWIFYSLSLLAYVLGLISKTSIVPVPIVLGLCLWWLEDQPLWTTQPASGPGAPSALPWKLAASAVYLLLAGLAFLRRDRLIRWVAALLGGPGAADASNPPATASLLVTIPLTVLACTLGVLLALWWLRGRRVCRHMGWVAPFLVLSMAAGMLTIYTQHHTVIGDVKIYDPHEQNLFWRLALAGRVPWFYLYKLLAPHHLLMIYPRWNIDPHSVLSYLPGAALVAALAALVYFTARGRAWARVSLIASLYFLALLAPVVGVLGKMYFMIHSLVADHLQYLAMIGPIVLIIGSSVWLVRRRGLIAQRVGLALAVVLVAALTTKTWRQGRYYKNQEVLWTYNLALNPNAWMACYNIGTSFANRATEVADPNERRQLHERSLGYFDRALRLRPDYDDIYNNYGLSLMNLGRIEEAKELFRRGIARSPDKTPFAYRNLGLALLKQERWEEALEAYEKGLEKHPYMVDMKADLAMVKARLGDTEGALALLDDVIDKYPGHVIALVKRALLHRQIGRGDLAEQDARQAIQTQDIAETRMELGLALELQGRNAEALTEYIGVLGLEPGNWMAHFRAGLTLARVGRPQEAIQHYVNVVGIQPNFVEAYGNLALLLAQQGDLANAEKYYRQALALSPEWAEILMDYARLLVATDDPSLRNVPQALEMANRACRLTNGQPNALETLALVQAEAGQFEQAQASARGAMEAAARAGDMASVKRLDELIQMCKAGTTPRLAIKARAK